MEPEFDRPSTGEALDELRKALQNVEGADIDKLFDRMQKGAGQGAAPTPVKKPLPPAAQHSKSRAKTSLRMQYEAQVQITQKNLGNLEEIRHKLGLSKRKICQLLLIDPSAWTRWTNFSQQMAPPHIYRMLEWYLLLQEKHPSLNHSFWLASITSHSVQSEIPQKQIRKLEADIVNQLEEKLGKKTSPSTKIPAVLTGFALGIFITTLIYFIIR